MSADFYEVAKDFSSLAATLIAAVSASWITWKISDRQRQIMLQQVDIARSSEKTALDQLKFNLMKERRAIYECVKEQFMYIMTRRPDEELKTDMMYKFFLNKEEAKLYFSTEVCVWLDAVWQVHQSKLVNALGDRSPENYVIARERLDELSYELPKIFQKDLQFAQLVEPRTL